MAGLGVTVELLKRIARPTLSSKQEREAFALAVQVFMQMPEDIDKIRVAYEHFHGWMDEWIATGRRPDLSAAECMFDPAPVSAEILPFRRVRDALHLAPVWAAGVAATVAIYELITQNVTVFNGIISLLDVVG